MKKSLLSFIILIYFLNAQVTYSQKIVFLDMPKALVVNAGADTTVSQTIQITLGGDPTAEFGFPPYQFLWVPATFLSNSTIANPVATANSTINYTLYVSDAYGCVISDEVAINVINSINQEVSDSDNVLIYPNPTSKNIEIDFKHIKGDIFLSIVDITGKQIKEWNVHISEDYKFVVDLQKYSPGCYLINIKNDKINLTKIIIRN